jgi:hypothetical protein
MDDLNGITIDGKGIDLKLYNFDQSKSAQILSFVEFCYSFNSNKQSDYGLYVYIYNPQGYDFTKNQSLNKIQFRVGSGEFTKYNLTYLNQSVNAGYEGLFYKFKVELSSTQRAAILAALNSTERIYEVSGVELYSSGTNAIEYIDGTTYTYSGYAEGYGSETSSSDTLTCKSAELMTMSLEVKDTYYRPDGTNGKNNYTQDSLHSVYFAIPNDVLKTFGGLSAVHATWLDAVTSPALVTDNETAYNEILKYVGKDVSEFTKYYISSNGTKGLPLSSDLEYSYVTNFYYAIFGSSVGAVSGGIGFNYHWYTSNQIENNLDKLSLLFFADNTDYVISSETIKDWLSSYTQKFGGELVLGKYSKELFQSVADEFTDINIKADDKYSLTSEHLSQNFWQKIFGGYDVTSTTFDNIEAIHQVTANDFNNSKTLTCNNLYIAQSDYDDFKSYYENATKADKTVYLFRYQVSDYVSEKASETTDGEHANSDVGAYFFNETVNLDFDIIDVTCSTGEVETVIPVVMSPMDIVHDATPPVGFLDASDFWKYALAIAGALIVFYTIYKLIVKGGKKW